MQKSPESMEQIRKRIFTQRKAFPSHLAAAAAEAACLRLEQLPAVADSSRVAVYLPVNGEIGTMPLIQSAWRQNKHVHIPVLQEGNTLLFAPYSPRSRMQNNRYGIPEPVPDSAELPLPADAMDVLIIPLVAFDSLCHRIGMGAGYYDRTLAACGQTRPIRIGLAYELQKVDSIQPHAWDIPMHKIVTENNVYTRTDQTG